MTVFVAGNEVEIFTSFGGAGPTIVTTSDVAIPNVNRAGILLAASGDTAHVLLPSELTEGWAHVRMARDFVQGTSGSTVNVFSLQNSTGQILARVTSIYNTLTFSAQILSGTTVTNLVGGGAEFDFYWKMGTVDGICRVYHNGSLILETLGNVQFGSGTQAVARLVCTGVSSNISSPGCKFSQILVADTPTIGARVHTLPLTVSTTNQWTGTPTSVTGTTSAGTITESVVDEEISFNAQNFGTTLLSGNVIEAMVLSSSAQALSGSPVTRIQGRTRTGGTPYDAGGSILLTTGYTRTQHIMPTNPATGTAWTVTSANDAEFGLQAKA